MIELPPFEAPRLHLRPIWLPEVIPGTFMILDGESGRMAATTVIKLEDKL